MRVCILMFVCLEIFFLSMYVYRDITLNFTLGRYRYWALCIAHLPFTFQVFCIGPDSRGRESVFLRDPNRSRTQQAIIECPVLVLAHN